MTLLHVEIQIKRLSQNASGVGTKTKIQLMTYSATRNGQNKESYSPRALRRVGVFLSPQLNEEDTQKLFQEKTAEATLTFLRETQIGANRK